MNIKNIISRINSYLHKRSNIIVVAVAALVLGVMLGVLNYYSYNSLKREAENRAENQLSETALKIRNVLEMVETATKGIKWPTQKHIGNADMMNELLTHLVAGNINIRGAGIGFVADYHPSKGRWYEPYVVQHSDGTLENKQLGGPDHDYLKAEWFTKAIIADSCIWSEPYYDEVGAHTMVATYACPIHDERGKIVAVLGTDLSLDWLSKVINKTPGIAANNIMVSREGRIMACPVESLVMNKRSIEISSQMHDTMALEVDRRMMAGESGQATVWNNRGEKTYVFYAPVDKSTGWSMAVICKDKDIFGDLRRVSMILISFMLLGLGMLALLLWLTAKQTKRMQQINSEKESIGSELRIAKNIQQAMMPKVFPPYPDRDDIEVFGLIDPAKEVGGDLFDFYIRDEKLFFCIGDVSGKGVPASLVMAVTKTQFRAASAHESNAVRIMELMNESMTKSNESSMFVTLFIGVLDLPTGRLRYCNAGHERPLLIGQASEGEQLNTVGELPVVSNIPLGIMADFKFKGQETTIRPHTNIFLYTDGLSEAEDIAHNQFGDERVIEVAKKASDDNFEGILKPNEDCILRSMRQAVSDFVGNAEQSDDMTMLVVKYTKEKRLVTMKKSLTLENDINNIPLLNDFVSEVAEEIGFDDEATMELNLAIEEAVVNVMKYAYPLGTKGDMNITAECNDIRMKFTITDSGMPFDPTTKEDADTTLSAEDRPIGGLGIYLVRQLMDSMNYERINGKNVLTLRKKLTSNA